MAGWTNIDQLPRTPEMTDFSIDHYKTFGVAIVKESVREYLEATHFLWGLYDNKKAELQKKTSKKAEYDLGQLEGRKITAKFSEKTCMDFFRSGRFQILMPNTNQEWFVKAIQEKAKRTCYSPQRI